VKQHGRSVSVPSIGASCKRAPARNGDQGLESPAFLAIPVLGLEAPVEQGISDAVLSDSVGHDPSSALPGTKGIAILLAHDVSYFSALGSVQVGDRVYWIDDCRSSIFKVDRIEVTRPGASLPAPSDGYGIALVTCWPSNALFWTADRLVVLANLVKVTPSGRPAVPKPVPVNIALSVPSILASEGLGVSANGIRVGRLVVTGTPDRSWEQSADPLDVARIAFEELVAVKLTVDAGDKRWWSDISVPGVRMPPAFSVSQDFDATEEVSGTQPTSVRLSSPAATVNFVVRDGRLYVSSAG
jgi:LPXTG-site transpeptidase (sortase) family protein